MDWRRRGSAIDAASKTRACSTRTCMYMYMYVCMCRCWDEASHIRPTMLEIKSKMKKLMKVSDEVTSCNWIIFVFLPYFYLAHWGGGKEAIHPSTG